MAQASNNAPIFRCQECGAQTPVPPGMEGKTGRCPVCDAKVAFPQGVDAKIFFRCTSCKAGLNAAASSAGSTITCPKCKKHTRIIPENPGGLGVQKLAETTFKAEDVNRHTKLAWAEMEAEKRDTYYGAVLRAFTYPIQAMGVVVFFVLGIPLVSAILGAIANYAVSNFGAAARQGPGGGSMVATLTVILGIIVFMAVAGGLASLLFAVTRVSSVGSDMVPVIQGMYHRENLASFAAWVFMYIGPGLFMGLYAGSHQPVHVLWAASPGAIFFFVLFIPIAPMAFLATATLGGNTPFKFGAIFSSIGKNFGDYCYLLLMIVLAGALFIGLGCWMEGIATRRFALPGNGNTAIGMLFMILAGCFYVFPAVTMARMVGLFGQYHRNTIALNIEAEPYARAATLSRLIMFAGLVILFFPLNTHMQEVSRQGGLSLQCLQNLKSISDTISSRTTGAPLNEKEMLEKFRDRCICPYDKLALKDLGSKNVAQASGVAGVATEGAEEAKPAAGEADNLQSSYAVIELKRNDPGEFILMHDKKPHPDGYYSILFRGGDTRLVSSATFTKLMGMQKNIVAEMEKHPNFEQNPDEKEAINRLIKEMQTARILAQ